MLKWLKIALAAVAGFLLLVVILQNTEPVVTRILSAEVTMPRAVFLFVLLASGFVLGYATCLWQRRRRRALADAALGEEAASSPGAGGDAEVDRGVDDGVEVGKRDPAAGRV